MADHVLTVVEGRARLGGGPVSVETPLQRIVLVPSHHRTHLARA